jgi:hypothetical protein
MMKPFTGAAIEGPILEVIVSRMNYRELRSTRRSVLLASTPLANADEQALA